MKMTRERESHRWLHINLKCFKGTAFPADARGAPRQATAATSRAHSITLPLSAMLHPQAAFCLPSAILSPLIYGILKSISGSL